MKTFATLALVVVLLGFLACDPRQSSGFKQEAKRQEDRITRETEEAIKNSPALQELDHLCTMEIPRPADFLSIKKSRDFNAESFLSYGFHSALDYPSVKTFYLSYFTQHGWQFTEQKDGGWGPSVIEFRKDIHKVRVYDMGEGEGENYALVCAKL